LGTKHPWKELQRQSLELRQKDGPSRDCHIRGSIPNHHTNADTIAQTSKILLKAPRYSCLFWDYAGAWQTQEWMLTVSYWMDHRAPNGGARESIQGAKEICNPVGETTLWTNQYPRALDSSCICIKRWPSQPSLEREAHWTRKLYMPQYRGTPGPKSGNGWVGEWGGGYGGLLG
jgi:hypothetical protein